MAAPDKDDVIDTIRQLAAFGVQVYITEMDVDLARIRGSQAERLEFQARVYRDIIEACLQSGVCTSFATWGISDSASWLTCEYLWCLGEANAAPLMFDASFHPKPAFFAVREALAR